MATALDVVNLILGIAGILALIPTITRFVKKRLPAAQLRYLDDMLAETEGFLLSLEEKGTFRNPYTASHFRRLLSRVRREAEEPRMETYCATSIWMQLKGLFNGLSKKLSVLGAEALRLRAEISTTATEDLKRSSSSPDDTRGENQAPAVNDASVTNEEHSSVITSCGAPSQPASPGTQDPSDHDLTHPGSERPSSTPTPGCRTFSHLGDPAAIMQHTKKRSPSRQYIRRSQRYHASHRLSAPSVARMEHRKSGIIGSDHFKRVLRSGTLCRTCSVCASDPDCLPLHVGCEPDGHIRTSDVTIVSEMWNLVRIGRVRGMTGDSDTSGTLTAVDSE